MAREFRQAGLSKQVQELPFGRVVYLDNGKTQAKDTLLLLHGAGADKSSWLPWVKAFGHARRILVIDLPGHGESTQDLTLGFELPAQAERLMQFISALGLARMFHEVGPGRSAALMNTMISRFDLRSILDTGPTRACAAQTLPLTPQLLADATGHRLRPSRRHRLRPGGTQFPPPS